MDKFEIPELNTPFVFRKRPVAIPGDLRPSWRIGLIVLLLNSCCQNNRSSLTRLHVLSWGVRTKIARLSLQSAIRGTLNPDALVVRMEPSLNRAVDLAWGEGLIRRVKDGKFELTPAGMILAKELEGEASAYQVEKEFMNAIGNKVTESLISKMFR